MDRRDNDIGASRRGEICGFQIGETIKVHSIKEAQVFARLMYEELCKAHYAHIEPESEFINGVVHGIRRYQCFPYEKVRL